MLDVSVNCDIIKSASVEICKVQQEWRVLKGKYKNIGHKAE